jgi:hypothetical protein
MFREIFSHIKWGRKRPVTLSITHNLPGREEPGMEIVPFSETATAHREPEYSPGDDTEERKQIAPAIRGSQVRLFGAAPGLENLVKHVDLPPHAIFLKQADGCCQVVDGQIGEQLPVDPFPIRRWMGPIGWNLISIATSVGLPS